jgi:hypothetical protein
MGESAAETVREIEAVRSDLEGKVRVLERRLPKAAVWAKKAAGIAVGGGAGSTVFWFVVRRMRKRKAAASKPKSRRVAQVGSTVIELAVPEISDEARPWLYGAAAAWILIRLADIRETRRMNRLLAKRAVA